MAACSRRLLLGSLALLLAGPRTGQTQPAEFRTTFPSATLAGSVRMRFLGFAVYDARLWVEPGFKAAAYDRHVFALELAYLRDFTNAAITQRSLDEMQRQPGFPFAQREAWRRFLRGAFPDVRSGDTITGIHRPGTGTTFITNGAQTGASADLEFGRFFFGIWLSAHTSEPRLRDALLAGAPS